MEASEKLRILVEGLWTASGEAHFVPESWEAYRSYKSALKSILGAAFASGEVPDLSGLPVLVTAKKGSGSPRVRYLVQGRPW